MSISERLVTRYFQAMETGDNDLFDDVYAEDAVFTRFRCNLLPSRDRLLNVIT